MFNHSASRRLTIPTVMVAVLLTFALFATQTESACGQQPLIAIERTDATILGTYEYIDISYNPNGSTLLVGGFDFLVSYDATILSFINATPGQLLTDCGWEYFTYRFGAQGNCAGSAPSGLVRVIALAEDAYLSGAPTCLVGESGAGVLATLKYLVTNDHSYECQSTPLQFYWCDCGDNAVASTLGDTLLVADTVYWGVNPNEFYPVPAGLYTTAGMPDVCIDATPGTYDPVRAINFREGVIEFTCANFIDNRGDLNLNSVAYEIADRLIFSQYFLYGMTAFDPNPLIRDAQIEASDVNADSVTLTYRDLVYLHRVIIGDALPIFGRAPQDTLTATVMNNTVQQSVTVSFSDYLAGAFLEFDGEITPTFFVPTCCSENSVVYDNGRTRILMSPNEQPETFPSGTWFTYTGTGNLVTFSTADWYDNEITVDIKNIGQEVDCGDFNADGSLNISDAVYAVRYVFAGGPAPLDLRAGDINCDSITSIADIVYLISYIFAGGPAPCANCR